MVEMNLQILAKHLLKISRLEGRILTIFVFLNAAFGYIFQKKAVRSSNDHTKVFLSVMEGRTIILSMIHDAVNFWLHEMYT